MLARTIVLSDEDPDKFQQLLDSLIVEFYPAGDVQLSIVEEMAVARWRQGRAWAVESRLLENGAVSAGVSDPVERITHSFSSLAAGPELALLHRYETRQTRIFQRALQNLLLLRKQKSPNEPNPNCEHGLTPAPEPEPAPEPVSNPEPPPPQSKAAECPPPAPIPLVPFDLGGGPGREFPAGIGPKPPGRGWR